MSGRRFAGRNTPAVPQPEDVPVAPLPPLAPDDQPAIPDQPAVPLPPIVEPDRPVTPLPPIVQPDRPTNPDQIPVVPLPPIVGTPEPGPVYPQQPPAAGPDFGFGGNIIVLPGLISPGSATVRFLNAAAGYDALRITVGNRVAASGLPFGSLTGYGRVGVGFRTVTVARAAAPREIIYRRTLPFTAGELATLAVVRTNIGLDIVRISDTPCRDHPNERACIRAVNLCWDAPALDVFLNDGRLVFNDVRYKETTDFRQAWPMDYGFYIAQTSYVPAPRFSDIETIEDSPVVAPGYFLPGVGGVTPLASFYINAKRNGIYTAYFLGSWNYPNPDLRVRVVEDFQ